jgi:D-alanyl-D-alanine carboxypeptidase
LLGRFNGANGMKTGFVCASGFNLVASATQNGRTLVAVILGATSQEQRAEKAANMLAAGFNGSAVGTDILSTMQPTGPIDNKAIDMRNSVCTKEAEAERWDGRQIEGKIEFESPYIQAMNRAPTAIKVGLATQKTNAINILDDVARLPIPQVKPARSAALSTPLENAELRPTVSTIKPQSATK